MTLPTFNTLTLHIPHLLIKTLKNLTIAMDKIQLTSWDGDINALYTYMSYIYSYLIWFAASFHCMEVSVVLVGTIQQTRRSALLGFDPFENPFDHHSRIRPQIWPQRASQPPFWSIFLVGKYQAKQKKHWRSEGDPMNETWERHITILQPEPNTLQ